MTRPSTPRRQGPTRRDFLATGSALAGLGLAGLSPLAATERRPGGRAVIQLCLVGGPGHLDTWDPKPDAPPEVRGPFRPIRTRVPGTLVSELFPRMAERADRFALVRSLCHGEAPIHETGQQLLQTGQLCLDAEWPHVGAVAGMLRPSRGVPSWVILPGPMGDTGVHVSHGQSAGFLGANHEPTPDAQACREPVAVRERYGSTRFGDRCLQALRLVESGVGFVTVNMFDTVFGTPSWDCHANGGDLGTTLDDYADTICPSFDLAFTALLDDLHDRGLLEQTLVVAMGEFGRTPKINVNGGRDHWTGAWTAILAGGGIRGGRVVGATDRIGGEPRERPVRPAEVVATLYRSLGIDPRTSIPGPNGRNVPLCDAEPIAELF